MAFDDSAHYGLLSSSITEFTLAQLFFLLLFTIKFLINEVDVTALQPFNSYLNRFFYYCTPTNTNRVLDI